MFNVYSIATDILTRFVFRLHWRVRGGRQPPQRQDCCPAQRPVSTQRWEDLLDVRVLTVFCSLNKCGVISPRYNVRLAELEKWVVKLLPARQFGYVILTTSAGIMDHEEARRKHVAGKIIGFFY